MEGEFLPPHKMGSVRGILGDEFASFLDDAIKRKYVSSISIGLLDDKDLTATTTGSGVDENSRYEMGSITKSFTAELLLRMIETGKLRWDDRLESFLPSRSRFSVLPETRSPITLGDLAIHRSGLALPENFRAEDRQNPNGSFSRSELIDHLQQVDLTKAHNEPYKYSSIGYAALGFALEEVSEKRFADLLQEEILIPLKLDNTFLAQYGQDGPSIVQGHAQGGRPVPPWKQDAFGPAGGLCSTVPDMLRWCQFSIRQMRTRTGENTIFSCDVGTAMGWVRYKLDGWYERSGETGGFATFLAIHVPTNRAVVLLTNRKSTKVLQVIAENAIRALNGDALQPLVGSYGKHAELLLDLHLRSKISAYLVGKVKMSRGGIFAVKMMRAILGKSF